MKRVKMNERLGGFLEKNGRWMGHDTSPKNAYNAIIDGALRSALDVLLRGKELEYEAATCGFFRWVSPVRIRQPKAGDAERFAYDFTNWNYEYKSEFVEGLNKLSEDEIYSAFEANIPHYERALKEYTVRRVEGGMALKQALFRLYP